MSDLEDLLERVKGLPGPLSSFEARKIANLAPFDRDGDEWEFTYRGLQGSLDAVVALCEKVLPASETWTPGSPPSSGWRIGVYRGLTPASFKYGHWDAAVFKHGESPDYRSAKTPALALLAALLEALVKSRSSSLAGE